MTPSLMDNKQDHSRINQPSVHPPSSSSWLFTTNTRPAQPQSSSSQMIGPTSTFYDPESVATQDPHSQDYQTWLESYINSHGQRPIFDSHPVQNQYSFVPAHYSSSNVPIERTEQYTPTPPHQPSPSSASTLRGAVSYHQHTPEHYYYSSNVTDHQSQPQEYEQYSTPISISAPSAIFSTSSVLDTPGSNTVAPYAPGSSPARQTVYAPSTDLLSLPASQSHTHSRSNSSLSPSAWTEDSLYSSASHPAPSQPPTVNPPVHKQPNAVTAPSSSRRGPGKKSAAQQKGKRKRQKKNDVPDTESGSDDELDGGMLSTVVGGSGMTGPDPVVPTRLQGACTVCKRLKMRCEFPTGDNTCKRCKAGGHVCVVEGRKPRTAPNKREYLMAQLRQKDAIIESLLKQIHNPYRATPLAIASYRMATSPLDQNNRNVLDWLDRLQASVRTTGEKGGAAAFRPESRLPPARTGEADAVQGDDDSESEQLPQRQDPFGLRGDDGAGGGADDDVLDPDRIQALPDASVPLGLIASLSISNTKAKEQQNGKGGKGGGHDTGSDGDLDDDNVGVANDTYFMPGPASDLAIRASLIERHSPPEILVHGLVVAADVDKLFDIFYTRVNPFISLLDPVLHTPASTFSRCPFLFTVVCAVSSRYYAEKSEIYPIAMHFAKHSAANALIDGWKSVELCQAYILLSIYAVPAKKWEEDRSWLYTGLAIRIATDLNLHRVSAVKPQNERQEREILNRTRVWLICFNLDRSTATQFGKPVTIKEDYIVRNSKDWYQKSEYNHKYDVHLCAYSSLLRIVARFHDDIFSDPNTPTGLNNQVDFRAVTLMHDDHLTRFHDEWAETFANVSDPNDRGSAFRCTLLPFLVGYSRLVMFSFGFQQAYQRGVEPEDQILFTKCLESATSVVKNFVDVLAPSGYMRFAPDGHFIFACFASAFLLKLLRPDFSNLLSKQQENDIFNLIGKLIQMLSSPEIAIDDRHTPRLYARFLAGLLTRHRRDGTSLNRQPPPPPAQSQVVDVPKEQYNHTAQNNPTNFTDRTPQNGAPTSTTQAPQDGACREETLFEKNGVESESVMFHTPTTYSPNLDLFTLNDFGLLNNLSEEDMLATMQALKNPAWWQNMMMPGFSWPDAQVGIKIDSYNRQAMHNPSAEILNGLGGFLVPEVSLH